MARKADSEFLIFLSTSAVYGDAKKIPTSELMPIDPISNYAEFKVLAEKIIEYYSKNYGIKAATLRLANIVGRRSDHGVIYDLARKLGSNPNTLELLGDGTQRKSYLYIDDTINAINLMMRKMPNSYGVFNVGTQDCISVKEIAKILEQKMGVSPKHLYRDSGGGRGWNGDVKHMQLDTTRIRKLGWKPELNSSQAISKAVDDLLAE